MKPQILIPLDGSPLAESVIPQVAAVARLISGGVTLLRAAPMPVLFEAVAGGIAPTISSAELWQQEYDEAHAYLKEAVKRPEFEGLPVKAEIIEDQPAHAIVEYARNAEVAMVAMATHGRTGLSRWVFGSVAEKVLHAAPKPLLLVRPHEGDSHTEAQIEYNRILVPLDGSDFAEQALEWARVLAEPTKALLVLVSAIPERTSTAFEHKPGARWTETALRAGVDKASCYLLKLAESLRSEGLKVHTKAVEGPPAETILDASGKERADLIVMATHGRSGLQRLWLGSVALKVAQSATIPVLLVRAHEPNVYTENVPG